MSFDPGMPQKVLSHAMTLGELHNDCLAAGDPCVQCAEIVVAAFDHFYGHVKSTSDVLSAILADVRDDLLRDGV